METTILTQQVKVITLKTTIQPETFWQKVEHYRFSIIPLLLVSVACIGGIVAGFGAKDDIVKLALIAFPTIITLAFTLAVAPMRLIAWAAAIAILLQMAVFTF